MYRNKQATHKSSDIQSLLGIAVKNAVERRELTEEELAAATGGIALSSVNLKLSPEIRGMIKINQEAIAGALVSF